MSEPRALSYAEAMRMADIALRTANEIGPNSETTRAVYLRVAEVHIAYARELRESVGVALTVDQAHRHPTW
jgi:hypothetical protein